MRLIDADEMLINVLEAYMKAQPECDRLTANINKVVHTKIQQLIVGTPTAYDVDKVVEQLEHLDLDGIRMKEDGKHYLIRQEEAIEIVKAGGTDEN